MAIGRGFYEAARSLIEKRLYDMHDAKHDEQITELKKLIAPYGKEVIIQDVAYENGMHVLRVRIREGQRFTIFDLDVNSTTQIADVFSSWIAKGNQ